MRGRVVSYRNNPEFPSLNLVLLGVSVLKDGSVVIFG
jgi:hypothetical protein